MLTSHSHSVAVYCAARLPRAGLANRLFPYARCLVYSQRHGLPMLAPRWSQIKIGPLLRRETDSRLYNGMFSRPNWQLGGLRRLFVWLVARKIPEPADLNVAITPDHGHGSVLV